MRKKIPTNIITGFLGVGKTTAISYLLRHKPEHEVWSVLVNEFGEIGIDGSMLQGANAHVREVPGGCICCVAGLPMKIALNMLIATTKPDRVLIEPTGLGHPAEIIQTLTGEYYDEVLDLRATLTLVDPRKLSDSRYSENANFQDQLAVADVVVANKMDLVEAVDERSFELLLQSFQPPKLANYCVTQGQLNAEWLNMARNPDLVENKHRYRGHLLKPQRELLHAGVYLPEGEDFIRRENKGQDFYSCGWLFRPEWVFDFNQLFLLMTGLLVMRAKAVMRTDQGVYIFNSENGVLSVNQLERLTAEAIVDSRIELIDDNPIANDAFEQQLMPLIKH